MTFPPNWRLRLQLAALALLVEVAHLSWEAQHGGIRVHHFMNRSDLPGLHNAWGLMVLPLLAFWATTRVRRRRCGKTQWIVGSTVALFLGGALSVGFHLGAESFTAGTFFITILLAIVLPGYRAECLLGWVLGMSWTFGAVLPTFIGTLIVGLSALLHLVAWPAIKRLWLKSVLNPPPNEQSH